MKRIFDLSIIKSKFFIVMMIMIVLIHALIFFPTVRFNDTSIPMLAFDRLVGDPFRGRVLGNHILETEHGEIVLRHFTPITAGGGRITNIRVDEFISGQASHNLAVDGITMPPNISISFASNHQIATMDLQEQEILLSGIPLAVTRFHVIHPREIADITMTVGRTPESIRLADYTQIYVDPARWLWGGLRFYNDAGAWVLREVFNGFMVKRPGETDFIRYREITFRPHWGEFIEGVRWEQ